MIEFERPRPNFDRPLLSVEADSEFVTLRFFVRREWPTPDGHLHIVVLRVGHSRSCSQSHNSAQCRLAAASSTE
eukprot:m.123279 g.123279  ORF g.123279 m.123279 type:complete len:74 (-) comp13455_c0_seq1:129-350(-)